MKKFILGSLGSFLCLLCVWYVLVLYFKTGSLDMTKYHLDLAATFERYLAAQKTMKFDFNSLIVSFNSFNAWLNEINSLTIWGKIIMSFNGGTLGNGFNYVLNVLNALFDPVMSSFQILAIGGYVAYFILQFLAVLFTCIQPIIDILFNPVFITI